MKLNTQEWIEIIFGIAAIIALVLYIRGSLKEISGGVGSGSITTRKN